MKYLYQIIESPNQYPLACYFLSHRLPNLFSQNGQEMYYRAVPHFYENTRIPVSRLPPGVEKRLINS